MPPLAVFDNPIEMCADLLVSVARGTRCRAISEDPRDIASLLGACVLLLEPASISAA